MRSVSSSWGALRCCGSGEARSLEEARGFARKRGRPKVDDGAVFCLRLKESLSTSAPGRSGLRWSRLYCSGNSSLRLSRAGGGWRLEDASACPWADWLDDELDMPCWCRVHGLEGHVLWSHAGRWPCSLSKLRRAGRGCGLCTSGSNCPIRQVAKAVDLLLINWGFGSSHSAHWNPTCH